MVGEGLGAGEVLKSSSNKKKIITFLIKNYFILLVFHKIQMCKGPSTYYVISLGGGVLLI